MGADEASLLLAADVVLVQQLGKLLLAEMQLPTPGHLPDVGTDFAVVQYLCKKDSRSYITEMLDTFLPGYLGLSVDIWA